MKRMNSNTRLVSALGLASAALTALTLYSAAPLAAQPTATGDVVRQGIGPNQVQAPAADRVLLAQQGRGPGAGMGGGYGRGGGQGRGMGMGRGMGPGGGMGRNMANFATFDRNNDGTLTETEFNEARAARIQDRAQQGYRMRNLANAPSFQSMDANHDGQLDQQEFSASRAARVQQMRQQSMPMAAQPNR